MHLNILAGLWSIEALFMASESKQLIGKVSGFVKFVAIAIMVENVLTLTRCTVMIVFPKPSTRLSPVLALFIIAFVPKGPTIH